MSSENQVCEWCGDWIRGNAWFFNLSDGEYGYFCGNRCCNDASANGYYGSKHSSCFVTTAVCEANGLDGGCAELNALRAFRDRHMTTDQNRRSLLMRYYEVAPRIVESLDQSPERDSIYKSLLEDHIRPAVRAATDKQDTEAEKIYTDMMHWLEETIGI